MRVIDIGNDAESYRRFIQCKRLPSYRVAGSSVITDEQSYAAVFGSAGSLDSASADAGHLFDYQQHVVTRALGMRRFAAFLDCGLGKTAIELEWCHAVARSANVRVLMLCPLAVLEDVQRFCQSFYGYRMSNLRHEKWSTDIAILNWESMRDMSGHDFGAVCLDESSILKNSAGQTRKWLQGLVNGCEWRLAASATPSPNEQAEYATHAVWLGYSATPNEFYSRFFIKDGTSWRLKGHAVGPFYRNLREWCCYIQSPSALGFADTQAEMPTEPEYIVIDCDAPDYLPQGQLFATNISLQQANRAFGAMRSDTEQPRFSQACGAVSDAERAIVWASRNAEEQALHSELGGHLITGVTPVEERVDKIDDFRAGRVSTLISKPKILGFGVNIPEATDMLYSGYNYSFEQFYQAVRRSHRFGRSGRLKVHIPVADIERPVWNSLRSKMRTFNEDVQRLQGQMRHD